MNINVNENATKTAEKNIPINIKRSFFIRTFYLIVTSLLVLSIIQPSDSSSL